MRNVLLLAAQGYARRGLRVVPVGRDKRPFFRGWRDAATTNAEQIERWWTERPHANVAALTGSEAGFFVLDVDPRNGGDESLAMLERTQGALRPTLTCRTGGGGLHFYYRTLDCPVASRSLAPGLETKGDGGTIILPPSVHASGVTYTWVDRAQPITVAPFWLISRVRPPERCSRQTSTPMTCSGPYARRALELEVERVRAASVGSRNTTLNASAFSLGQLVAAGLLAESSVVAALLSASVDSGLSEREATGTIRSGLRAGQTQPRDLNGIRGLA